eukprot:CAMPEP_0206252504 /NCGR_PEP_ID=MMETSP0047_2-20121206/22629_1 /ASSEMBLY_ACC=CAM_ASM_000192 /TAXON_ID=195065 /ORGANISM="Chroomonas mesostigmatica_cf, Strain CCMP1168" /LENGTH=99 /DNA_ID=CAMNT_0053678601 /DNA_START=82 /DNA_END=377 /DNA_ORIENTATION=+
MIEIRKQKEKNRAVKIGNRALRQVKAKRLVEKEARITALRGGRRWMEKEANPPPKSAGSLLWEDSSEDAKCREPCHNYGTGITRGLKEKRKASEEAYLR